MKITEAEFQEIVRRIEILEENVYLKEKRKNAYAKSSEKKRTLISNDSLGPIANNLEKAYKIIQDVLSGQKSLASACFDEKVPYLKFRRAVILFGGAISGKEYGFEKAKAESAITWEERLYADVFDLAYGTQAVLDVMPDDYEETIEEAIRLLPPKEQDVIRCRYTEGKTLQEIGMMYGVTKERIRQISDKCIRKLKSHKDALRCGKQGILEVKEKLRAEKEILIEKYQITFGYKDKDLVKLRSFQEADPDLLILKIECLPIGTRVRNSLVRAGIETVGDTVSIDRDDLYKIRNFGQKGIDELVDAIHALGLLMRWERKEAGAE